MPPPCRITELVIEITIFTSPQSRLVLQGGDVRGELHPARGGPVPRRRQVQWREGAALALVRRGQEPQRATHGPRPRHRQVKFRFQTDNLFRFWDQRSKIGD